MQKGEKQGWQAVSFPKSTLSSRYGRFLPMCPSLLLLILLPPKDIIKKHRCFTVLVPSTRLLTGSNTLWPRNSWWYLTPSAFLLHLCCGMLEQARFGKSTKMEHIVRLICWPIYFNLDFWKQSNESVSVVQSHRYNARNYGCHNSKAFLEA